MTQIKGTNVLAPVVPFDTTDTHASHEARYGKGGYRSVADIAERDAISQLRREAGMLVCVLTDGKVWRLASDLSTWSEIGTSGGGVATTSASALVEGTLPDGRLSANIATHATLAAAANQNSSALDIFPRGEANAANASPASGFMWMTFFTPAVTITVSSITMCSGNTTAAAGLTLARMGLYTFDESTATLVAHTASDTTLFQSLLTAYQRSFATASGFPASYTLTAGTRYGVAVVAVGSTIPSIVGRTVGVGVSALGPRMSGSLSSQSDLPTTATISASQQTQPFARLS
jgi:hypothetical protein